MAETITITQPETGSEAPVQETVDEKQTDRPEWLPEKFATPEDLAKSYGELEKKLSAPQEEVDATEETEAGESPKSEPQNFDKFATQFAEKGELDDESFAELEKMGYPREMVDTYIKGLQAADVADVDAVMGVAGGSDGYKDLTDWAKGNVDEKELTLYNQMVSSGTDNAKMAVEWLMSKRESAGDVEPTLISGKATAAAKDEFRSTQEVVSAMKDSRYGKDPAYTKDVEQKLARSKVF